VVLAISGLWLTRHGADFQWLREQARSGALEITWVNHSYHHPYVPGRPLANNLLLTPPRWQEAFEKRKRKRITNRRNCSIANSRIHFQTSRFSPYAHTHNARARKAENRPLNVAALAAVKTSGLLPLRFARWAPAVC
jgi:hypothetical protein